MGWFFLSLLCALALASADAATKAWLQDYSARELALVRFTLTALLLLPLLRDVPDLGALPPAFWGWMLLLWPLEIAAMLLYMTAIRDHPLSLTLPLLAFTPVFILGVAFWLLGERVPAQGAVGVVLVVAGAWLLNLRHARLGDWRSWGAPLVALVSEPGSRLMLAVALVYALTATMGKAALAYVPAEQFGALYFLSLGIILPLVLALPAPRGLARLFGGPRRRPASIRQPTTSSALKARSGLLRRPVAVLVVAALNALMVYTHFLALAHVEVAYMIAVKRTSLLFGILYGALLFREPGLRSRLPAGGLMLAGVVCILTA
ncbi:EamA family transporter [Thiohalocapsa marina]|uniref:EamA family transporter n=1 Tax=Thiohalocapsa marina TaxID=424902 RepID=A0A5M8FC08_9GAMM|nr:EamA family transporter [Thiohalocapsa marina]KAA6181874.1 EamA family transporter [Thiohalocapsa marina]